MSTHHNTDSEGLTIAIHDIETKVSPLSFQYNAMTKELPSTSDNDNDKYKNRSLIT